MSKQFVDASIYVFTDIVAFIRNHLLPEDVFTQKQLDKWAEQNGYTKKEGPKKNRQYQVFGVADGESQSIWSFDDAMDVYDCPDWDDFIGYDDEDY